MAKVTITFEDDFDDDSVTSQFVSDPVPEDGDEGTPAQKLGVIIFEYLDHIRGAADDTTVEAA